MSHSYAPLEIGRAHYGYIPTLDGLRALACMIVLLSHYQFSYLVPAGLGVSVFFVISGFIITRLCLERTEKENAPFAFYKLRFFRLAPALMLYLLTLISIDLISGEVDDATGYLGVATYTLNYMIHFNIYDDSNRLLGHLWSLSVEEHFYLLFPLGLSACKSVSSRYRLVSTLLVSVVIWRLILVLFFAESDTPLLTDDMIYRRSDTRFDGILVGVLAALMARNGEQWFRWAMTNMDNYFFIIGLVLMSLTLPFTKVNIQHFDTTLIETISLALTLPPILFGPHFGWARRILSSTILVQCGKISYAIYIWHVAVYWKFLPLFDLEAGIGKTLVATVITFAIAYISSRFIEMPIRQWSHQTNKQ